MGKPFKKELEKVFVIYQWAAEQSKNDVFEFLKESGKPTLIVGSGGSLSACYYLASLLVNKGVYAKAITPLEVYYSKNILNNSNIVFLSASGKNTDIIFGFNLAMQFEPNCIISICMKKDSPLAKLSKEFSNTKTFEYDIPSGKDGFLATNSLIAFFSILFHSYKSDSQITTLVINSSFLNELLIFCNRISKHSTFHILYGGWGKPVAIDIESKFTEAGLANSLLSDYRNFGHGRHHWFDKKKKSAIIALITPEEKLISKKTLALLPTSIPQLVLTSDFKSPLASIDLLIKSFYLVNQMGEIQKIDPGKPGVPDFGSKLYHLKYSSFYTIKNPLIHQSAAIAILRKSKVNNLSDLSAKELNYWLNAYNNFINKLANAKFGSIIFDFDGTLCSLEDRYMGLSKEIIQNLNRFLSKGFVIGVITGRGRSARKDLQKAISKEYWEQIIIGYYNGVDIGTLNNNHLPNKDLKPDDSINKIHKILTNYNLPYQAKITLRPNQLTIEVSIKNEWSRLKSILLHLTMTSNIENIQIIESSHSLDIISRPRTSKLNILPFCKEKAKSLGLSEDCLCIGDKGVWPGNDYELLSSTYSLSVREVSNIAESCWNIAEPGSRNIKATLEYLSNLEIIDKSIIYRIQ